MKKLIVKTYPKNNLTLDVLSKRPDGYHEVKMIMQTISLYDEVTIELIPSGIELSTNKYYLPNNQKNTAYLACQYFLDYFNINSTGVKIFIKKNLPVAAGIAGGSSNAAGVIKGLNTLLGIHAPIDVLMEIGKKVGADVPYCILGKTALAEGLGEKLTPLPSLPPTWICLAKPNFSMSTAKVYQRLDVAHLSEHPDTDGMIQAISQGDIPGVAKRLFNVLETVTIKQKPVLNKIKKMMMDQGALGCVMSGSGPTIFGLFATRKAAQKACFELRKHVGYAQIAKTMV